MKITKISYQKSFIIGPYLQEKIGIEVEIEAGDNEDTVFCMAKDQVDRWHKENSPHLYQESKPPENATLIHPADGTKPYYISTEKSDPAETLALIQNAPDMATLTTFKLIASSEKTLYSAYCQRLKELA